MGKYWRYLRYVIRHKYFVFQAGWKLGVPLWQLIIHDWSKFLPCEFIPYAKRFYGNYGESFKPYIERDFERAWLHHQNRNKHHWQYYLLRKDSGEIHPLEIPYEYVNEMFADWVGVSLALGKDKFAVFDWYKQNKDKIKLHKETRFFLEEVIFVDWKIINS